MSNPQGTATGYPPPPAGAANGYPLGATGHPYGAPPPRTDYYFSNQNNVNPNPNMYYYQTPYTAQRATFFRRFVVGVISVLVILAVILFIVWLVLRPRVPEFRINSLTVSQLNATTSPSTQISGNWTAQLTALNPNSKMHVYYEEIDGFVFYKRELLAQNRLPPFDQGTKSEGSLTATLVASAAYVDDSVVSNINSDRSHGSVKFSVRLAAIVHFKARGWRTRRRLLRVLCDDLPVGLSSKGGSGTLTGGAQECLVSL